jgi:hypothetical protein
LNVHVVEIDSDSLPLNQLIPHWILDP